MPRVKRGVFSLADRCPHQRPLLACFDPFEDVDKLELDVIIAIAVGLKHLEHLHKKWAQDKIMKTMHNANRLAKRHGLLDRRCWCRFLAVP
jgi:pyruvate-formate lyase-activating enzyme